MVHGDTIAAISTPPGRGAVGVVRMSGPASFEITSSLFRLRSHSHLITPNHVHVGQIIDSALAEPIDTAILTYFKAPRSYTGEDVVELSCHGSPVILARLVRLVTAAGARIAEPGEFTLRAFLNQRMDLVQAQAVRDVIEAQTEYQARVATRQLEGGLSKQLKPHKEALIEVIVHLESLVEFVEEDISPKAISGLVSKLETVVESLSAIGAGFSFGRYIREGFDLAVVGRPNVGKSSVFNRLVGRDRAIVTEIPGTTRDALYENASVLGVPVRLIDTAGIRETSDVVESIGITRSQVAIADADVSLLVLDCSEPLSGDDLQLLKSVPKERRIILINKTDLPRKLQEGFLEGSGQHAAIPVSALTGSGFDQLTEALFHRLSGDRNRERDDILITDARQEVAVRHTVELLSDACELMTLGAHEEIVLLRLRGALEALGEITGETLTEDILSQIFSTFCIGK
jgi:tRNA modification GTPase